jgi:ATP-binding cassette, subfamily B (MDR/TAP), member 1
MLGSFLFLYFLLTLFGSYLIYRDIKESGCDPSGAVTSNTICPTSGPDAFGAIMGVAFAAQGVSQVGNFIEAFSNARISVSEALRLINRKPGMPEEIIYRTVDDDICISTRSQKSNENENARKRSDINVNIRAILPKYEIDSSSSYGARPKNISGGFSFKNVHFTYPMRPHEPVLNGLSVEIEAGKTVAFVGPRWVILMLFC